MTIFKFYGPNVKITLHNVHQTTSLHLFETFPEMVLSSLPVKPNLEP